MVTYVTVQLSAHHPTVSTASAETPIPTVETHIVIQLKFVREIVQLKFNVTMDMTMTMTLTLIAMIQMTAVLILIA